MENNEPTTPAVETPETNYLEIIQNMKKNTVSREEYERVIKDNKTLANALATSTPKSAEVEVQVASDDDIKEMRDKLFRINSGATNLEVITQTLNLRDALMSRGESDPFLPVNKDYVPNPQDQAAAQKLADGLREIVDYCNGDAQLFNSELKRVCR